MRNRQRINPMSWKTALAALVAVIMITLPACKGLDDPTSPTPPSDLDGQNGNQFASFDGSIVVVSGDLLGYADGLTDTFVTVVVRDAAGNPVSNATPITFATTFGTVRPLGAPAENAGQATQVFVFNGTASVAVRSPFQGDAFVTAAIANVSASTMIRFVQPTGDLFVSLVLQAADGDVASMEDNAPLDVTLRATVVDGDGQAVPAQEMRFTITQDTSGTARLSGRNTSTDTNGRGYAVLSVSGVGRVIVEAEAINSDGDAVAASNQVIATTRTIAQTVAIDLTFTDGSTVSSATAGTIGLLANVTDVRTENPLIGRFVQFVIESDNAATDPAELAEDGFTATDSAGQATNALITLEAGTTVTITARLNEGGETIVSNTVVFTVQ